MARDAAGNILRSLRGRMGVPSVWRWILGAAGFAAAARDTAAILALGLVSAVVLAVLLTGMIVIGVLFSRSAEPWRRLVTLVREIVRPARVRVSRRSTRGR